MGLSGGRISSSARQAGGRPVPSFNGEEGQVRQVYLGRVLSLSENHGGCDALVKVQIDRNDCTSCGSCWELCPDFFEESPEDHFSRITEPNRAGGEAEGNVPEDLEGCAVEAADACPVQIIHIE